MEEMKLLIDIILNLLIALAFLSVYEAQNKKDDSKDKPKPNPIIIEIFLLSIPALLFAFLDIKILAYFFILIFTAFFLFLFFNKYIEAINEGRGVNEDKSPIGAIKYRWKKMFSIKDYKSFKVSIIIVLILVILGAIIKLNISR